MNNFPSIVGGVGKKKKKNKYSACIHLKKENCKFPCRRVRSNKKRGTCRTRFSDKVDYLNMKTQRVIKGRRKKSKTREGRKKREQREKREQIITSAELQPEETPAPIQDYTTPPPSEIVPEQPVIEEPVIEEPAPTEDEPVPASEEETVPAPEEEPVPMEEPVPTEEPVPVPVEEPAPVEEEPVPVEGEPVPVEEEPVPAQEDKGVLGSIADGLSSMKDSVFGEAKKEGEDGNKVGGTRRRRGKKSKRGRQSRRKSRRKNRKKNIKK